MRLAQETGPSRKLVGSLFALSLLFGLLSLTSQYFLPVSLVKLAAAGAAAAVAGLLMFAYPKYGLLAAVFYIYADLTYIFGMHLSYPIVVVVVLAVFFWLLRGDQLRGPGTVFGAAATVFALMAIGSMLFSYEVGQSMVSFLKYAKVIVMVYLVVHLLRTPDDLDLFALVIFLGNIASVILGVLVLVFVGLGDTAILGQYGGMIRFEGTHANPNAAAAFMISALPVGAYLMIRARRALYRLALGVGMLVLFTGVVFTFSRQGIFSLVFILVAILVREVRSRKIYLATFATVVMSILLTPQLYWVRILSIGELFSGSARSSDWSFLLRVLALKKAWSLFLENPLTGVGMNNFLVRAGSEVFVKVTVHNMYLEILVGMGVFGFLAFLMVHLSALRLFRRTILERDRTDRIGRFAFYFLLAYVATMISGLFQSITFYYLIWLPLAGGLAAARVARDQSGPTGAVSVKLNSS